jgi:hypothetical protein
MYQVIVYNALVQASFLDKDTVADITLRASGEASIFVE